MNTLCKFVINIFWATQFEAVREGYFRASGDDNGKTEYLGDLFIYSFIYLFIYLFICLLIYFFISFFIYLFTYLFIYLFIYS